METKRTGTMNLGRICLFLAVAAVLLAASTADADPFRIRDCSRRAITDLNWAVDFIDNNLNAMLASSALNSADQVRIREHWPSTTIECESSNYCDRHPSMGGYQVAGANKVHLCWNNLLAVHGLNRCGIVGIIMHEKAHEANVPDSDQHADRANYSFEVDIDPVYRFENSVFTYCSTTANAAAPGSFNRSGLLVLGAAGDLAIGDYCDRNAQCRSGQCRWGECVCDENSDCESGFICNKVGKNRCVRAHLPLGASCDVNAQCQSGQCRRGNCVCDEDSDCPPHFRCKTAGRNECIPVGGNIGDVCNRNDDCVTHQCDRDVCVCATDDHCRSFFGDPNMRCRKLGQNHCQRTNLAAGERCHENGDCRSNDCRGAGSHRTCR